MSVEVYGGMKLRRSAEGPLIGVTTGERELASFESVGAGAATAEQLKQLRPVLVGTAFRFDHAGRTSSGPSLRALLTELLIRRHPREPPRRRIKGLLDLGHVFPGFGPVVPQLAGPGRRTPGGTKLSV